MATRKEVISNLNQAFASLLAAMLAQQSQIDQLTERVRRLEERNHERES